MFQTLAFLSDPKHWHASPTRPVAQREWFTSLILVICILANTAPKKTRFFVFTPILLLVLTQTWAVTTGDLEKDHFRIMIVAIYTLKFIDFCLLCDDDDLYKTAEKDTKKKNSKKKVTFVKIESFWTRFKKSLVLWIVNTRGVGWNWGSEAPFSHRPRSKWSFLSKTLVNTILARVTFDTYHHLVSLIRHSQPAQTKFDNLPLPTRLSIVFLFHISNFAFITTMSNTSALLFVFLNFGSASEYPPVFGPISEAYLVSRYWGRTWHQALRRVFGFPTPYVQRFLGVKSRSMRRWTSLLCSFGVSGFVHWLPTLDSEYLPSGKWILVYFLAQAVVMRLEDYVMDWGRAQGFKVNWMWKTLGYIWTFAWLWFSSFQWISSYRYDSRTYHTSKPHDDCFIEWLQAKMS